MSEFAAIAPRLLAWAQRHGRHDLPWQREVNAYRVWVSEIMLQQTQVAIVIPYFERFMQALPDVVSLADAPLDAVLAHWSGLGYYARARNLHKAALIVRDQFDGELPANCEALEALPGIGRSTAAAILALAHGQRHAILDGNAKRVLARYHAVPGWPGETKVARRLWTLAEQHTPEADVAAYTQAIMDLGAMVCTRGRPQCDVCPLADTCQACQDGMVTDYPGARPRRNQPVRQAVYAVVRNDRGKILLQKRPPAGIWGGLWCLPEWDSENSCRRWMDTHWPQAGTGVERLETIEHTFTHFRLQFRPLRIDVGDNGRDAVSDAGECDWYSPEDALKLGLPVPVRTLLETLQTINEETEHDAHGALRKTG
ncbi:MAG: A/G-specific adenine glycosylase [Gammaproteobacteria bacterium]|nr:A/G-specific adenine glycosylase [Gammaproteobacteria bacterium]